MKQPTETDELERHARLGIAVKLQVLREWIEEKQREYDALHARLDLLTNGAHSWAGMTAEERSAEMKRRMKKAHHKSAADSRWKKISKAEKEAWKAKMQAGKRKKAKAKKQSARQFLNGAAKVQSQGVAA